MAVAEAVDHVRRCTRAANHRQRIWQTRPEAHPLAEARRFVRRGEPRQQLPGLIEQDARTAPIRREIESAKLDSAGDSQAALHHGDDELALGIRRWNSG